MLHATSVLGEFCCVPAGSDPWSAIETARVDLGERLVHDAFFFGSELRDSHGRGRRDHLEFRH